MIENKSENVLNVNISGYEGPLDLLIELSKKQKVDITKVSILELAEQYLKFVNDNLYNLKLSADYLVMATFLAFLKSKLLIPNDDIETKELEEELTNRLMHYEAIKKAVIKIEELPQLDIDFFINKKKNEFLITNKLVVDLSFHDLIQNYLSIYERKEKLSLQMKKNIYFSVEDALKWLSRLFNDKIRSWENLKKFVPLDIKHLRLKKSAIISLLLASMSMARKGELKINQEKPFSNIFIKLIDKNEL
ncbi:MAG: hypothetical protein CMM91_10190 [Rickettsiales bacterium]|nr:hypothetical protein [Rickettsiales bacterium]OUV52846.1 MAG: hypothetical protein CBC87_05675 [Rickettsiales bacterium TMED127]